jgi:PleD family two-component response regulator
MDYPTSIPTTRADALILAVDESAREIAADLCRRLECQWPLRIVSQAGEALRQLHVFRPRALFVCVTLEQIDPAATVIAELNRRRHADQRLMALAEAHEELIERAVRAAGATYYFAFDSESDLSQLRAVLAEMDIAPTGSNCGPAPPLRGPPSRASPARRRARIGRSPFW